MNAVKLLIGTILFFTYNSVFATEHIVKNTQNSGQGSLRQAIIESNFNAGHDIISFNLAEGECDVNGVCRIIISSSLPTITDSMTIDGTTQPRFGTAPNNVCATESNPSYM